MQWPVLAQPTEKWVEMIISQEDPKDCEPMLFSLLPTPVSAAAGQPGRAAISWNACSKR